MRNVLRAGAWKVYSQFLKRSSTPFPAVIRVSSGSVQRALCCVCPMPQLTSKPRAVVLISNHSPASRDSNKQHVLKLHLQIHKIDALTLWQASRNWV